MPVKKTEIEKPIRFWNPTKKTKLRIEKQVIITVAVFGVTPSLIKPFAIRFIKGLNIYLSRNLEFDILHLV